MGVANNATIRSIELEETVEGDIEEVSNDYFFEKIGKPIPIVNDSSDSIVFDIESPPARPLAVSGVHRLIFLAHPSGFFVARTKDVMDAAKEIEAKSTTSSIEELSIASVSVGNVHILSLSLDSSTLAACVASDVHFFDIDSLIKKDLKPLSSCSLSDSSATIKDMQWRRRSDTSYLVLSSHGELCLGALGSPLKDVMDNVDAVEWSLKGKYIAVARENNLHIFSSKFKERLCISLPFKLWIGDSDDKCSVKVDSIRWICSNSIVLGCFQQLEDGKEENYFIQVIKSKGGRITDASSQLSVVSFYDVYPGLIDDIVPYGSGPYLFLSYLKQCRIAITANRKNTDGHIKLLHWPLQEDTSEVGLIDIDRDMWIPRIELQGNGDDNLVLGLCIDNVSLYEKVCVEEKELSPSCALFCVTLEGKLAMFYFAHASGHTISPEAESSLSDNEEDSLPDLAAGHTQSIRLNLGEQTFDQVTLGSQLKDVSKCEPNMSEGNEILRKTDLIPSGKNENSNDAVVPGIFQKDVISEGQNMESLLNLKPSVADGKEKVPVTELYQGVGGQRKDVFGQQGTKLDQSSLNNSLKHPSKAETDELTEFKPSLVAFSEKAPTFPSQSRDKDFEKSFELPKASFSHMTSTALQSSSTQPWSSGKPIFSGGSDSRLFFSSSSSQGLKSDNVGNSFETGFVSANLTGKPFLSKDSIGGSPSTNISASQTKIVEPKASMRTGKIDSLPSIRSVHLPSQETSDFGRSTNYKSHSSKESHRALSASSSEPHLSRQFGNIKEMTSELDALLESIERPGGFKDACTVSKRTSVEALEEHMKTLSGKCRIWKSLMDEQLGETQNLLDKTVQVLARKIYMDGIVKQATDSKYWELWNRQKLSSEFDLKRQHILKLNQVLTNQLIELEKHFNTLELQKFGENAGAHTGRRAFHSRYEPSRQIQSLHSLHNTTNSQLAAAEQLSECLTKQMEVLSIKSPVKQKNVKQELFESIGIPYDPTFSSPVAAKVCDSSPSKKLLITGSAVSKSQSRRRLSSAMKSSDSETARRRRESLDQSWASFEPAKTTIKRVLLQESQKTGGNTSSLKDRHQLDLSEVDRSARLMSPSTFTNQYGNRDVQYTPPEQAFGSKSSLSNWGNDSQLTTQASGLRSSMLPKSNAAMPSVVASQPAFTTVRTGNFAVDKSSHKVIGGPDNILINETKYFQQSEAAASHKKPSFSMELPAAHIPVLTKPSEMFNSGVKGNVTMDTKGIFTKSPSKSYESSFSLQTAAAPVLGEVPNVNVTNSKSQPSGKSSFSQAFSMSLSVPSSTMMNSKSTIASSVFNPSSSTLSMPFGMSVGSSKADTGANQTVSLTQSASSFSLQSGSGEMPSLVDKTRLSSSTSESLKTEVQLPPEPTSLTPSPSSDSSKPVVLQPKTSPSADSESSVATDPPPKSQLQHVADNVSSRTDVETLRPHAFTLKVEPPPVSSSPITETSTGLKVEPPISSAPRTEISTLGSGIQPGLNSMTSPGTGLGLNTQPKQPPPVAHGLFSASLTSDSVPGGESANLDVPAVTEEEDEMEEEAPETNNVNEFSLGSLGGFGLGSTPSPNVPKANPFGNPFGTVGTNQASSPFAMSVPSGELFRPASFSFQPPQPAQPSPPSNLGAGSGGFGVGQAPAPTFGQPAQIGAGQQALGSVLGSFGQSRQFGAGLPGGFAASTSSMGGFSTSGGFATAASSRGGFAGLASAAGGFGGAAASAGGGFAAAASGGGGGFAGAASGGSGFAGAPSGGGFGAAAAGGFGAFGSQQGGGGFSAFGNQQGGSGGFSSFGGTGKPAELFTQMRK